MVKNEFEWVIDEDDLVYAKIIDTLSLETALTALRPKEEIIIKARCKTDSGNILWNKTNIILTIAESTVELKPYDAEEFPEWIKLGESCKI